MSGEAFTDLALPIGLTSAIESGRSVLFLGAGIAHHACDADGRSAPSGHELALEMAAAFDIDVTAPEEVSLPTIAQIVEIRKGRLELDAFLTERLAPLEPDDELTWLIGLPWAAIFTTNYDQVIERAFEILDNPPRNPIVISASADVRAPDPRFEVPIVHLHGTLLLRGSRES
jgi:hypothetical protein